MEPLTQFLTQIKLQWKECLLFLFCLVFSFELVLKVSKFLSDIVEFHLDKIKKWYFDKYEAEND